MEEKRNYIVYQITNKVNNNIYIGCHITKNIKDNYLGSGTNIKKALKEFGQENFEKIILYNFDNEKDMLTKERELVNEEFIKRQDTYNIILGGSYNTAGTVTVKDKNNNYLQVSISDPGYLNGELVHIMVDMITVKDKNNNYFFVSKKDPKYLSGELISIHKNIVTVKDKNNSITSVSINDPRYLNGELVHIWKNRKHSEETKQKIGKTNSIKQKGSKNSQYGTCWITNNVESKKIYKGDLIPDGWKLGRVQKKNKI